MEKYVQARLRALSHPQRLRILAMVTAHPVCAAEVAATTGLAHAAASYHLRQLAVAGLVRVMPTQEREPRRGRPQRRYQMREQPFRGIGRHGMRLLERGLLTELERRLREAGATRRVTDAEAWLGTTELKRLRLLLREVNAIVHEQSRVPNSTGSKHISLTTVLLEHRK